MCEKPSQVSSAAVDFDALRAQFPVLERFAYLNAGTDGPLPSSAIAAAAAIMQRAGSEGRAKAHFELRHSLSESLRSAYAKSLRCEPGEVALTTCTSEGVSLIVDGLGLKRGDEILTSDEEHPGLLGALAAAHQIDGVDVRVAPFREIADAIGPRTALVACSHVSWMTGGVAPAELAEVDVPVLLDGAQGVGAVPCDVSALGCAAYAGPGQKWLCGPDGTGMLYVAPSLLERISVKRRGYPNMVDPDAGLNARLHQDARRLDTLALSAETLSCALASWEALDGFGWERVHERGISLSRQLAEGLAQIGRQVVPRGPSTLVSFSSEDGEGERAALLERGVILRDIPGQGWLRASVGAWNGERDLQRLLDALGR